MRIAIIAMGSRGDVQPYVALGKGLQDSGHHVRLATHENFEALVREHGLDFWIMRGNVQEVAESEAMRALLDKGNFLAISRATAQAAQQAAAHWANDGLAACQGMDLIIAGLGGLFIAIALAEKLELPLLQAYLVPFTPTKAFPSVLLPTTPPRLGGYFNRLTHHLTRQVMWQGARAGDKTARQEVRGLPAAPFFGPFRSKRLHQNPVLYGFSPTVLPPPADWGDHVHVTGYWFLDEAAEWTPPADLLTFLQADPPPVYVGFGSMGSRKPEETTALILKSLERTGQRAIMVSGWGGLKQMALPDTVMMVDSIPHAWLFPRVAAVIHHGGAGTTAAGLRAGIPAIITPFFGDQPFWGRRVADLMVGPEPIERKKLTVDLLAQAIHDTVDNERMSRRAAEIGATIRSEDGIAHAVQVIESIKL